MRIVHITTVHDPFDTRIFEKMCGSAVAAGCDVTLVAPHVREEKIAGVNVLPIRTHSNRIARATLGVREAIHVAKQVKSDIYHVHDPEVLLGVGALRRVGVVVYDMHENMAASIKHKEWISPWLRPIGAYLWTRLERKLLDGLPVIYAELSYKEDYPWVESGEFVLNMPTIERFTSLQGTSRIGNKIVYVGAVTAARGSLVTMQAIELLNQQNFDVEFLCIGQVSESHRVELQEYAQRSKIDNVSFKGRLRASEAWSLASTCQVGLATILPLPNYINSYPTKLFEYMAMGLPVVASDFPLYRKIVETHGCGICVDPENPIEVANAVRMLLENPERAKQMGQRGQNAVMLHYRWDLEAEKLLKFYDRVLAGRKAGSVAP